MKLMSLPNQTTVLGMSMSASLRTCPWDEVKEISLIL